MTPSHVIKKGVCYRCYVSCVLAQGRKEKAGSIPRVAADAVDRFVLEAIDDLSPEKQKERPSLLTTETLNPQPDAKALDGADKIVSNIERIILGSRSIEIKLVEGSDDLFRVIAIPWSPQTFRRKREIIPPSNETANGAKPIRAEATMKLRPAIANGRRCLDEIVSGKTAGIEGIASREGVSERSARMGLPFAFLAPDIVQAAVDGTLPRGLGVSRLTDLPARWADQRRVIGFAPVSN